MVYFPQRITTRSNGTHRKMKAVPKRVGIFGVSRRKLSVKCIAPDLPPRGPIWAGRRVTVCCGRFSKLKPGGKVAERRGSKRAKVALARKIGIMLHRMWIDGTTYRWAAAKPIAARA